MTIAESLKIEIMREKWPYTADFTHSRKCQLIPERADIPISADILAYIIYTNYILYRSQYPGLSRIGGMDMFGRKCGGTEGDRTLPKFRISMLILIAMGKNRSINYSTDILCPEFGSQTFKPLLEILDTIAT